MERRWGKSKLRKRSFWSGNREANKIIQSQSQTIDWITRRFKEDDVVRKVIFAYVNERWIL